MRDVSEDHHTDVIPSLLFVLPISHGVSIRQNNTMMVSDDLIMDCFAAIDEHPFLQSFQDVAEALHRYIEGGSTLEALSIISQCSNGQIVNSWDRVKEIPLTKAAQSGDRKSVV